MSFTTAVSSALRQYATFSGRARRAEYWWFVLFTVLVSLVAGIVDSALGTIDASSSIGVLGTVASLALLLPSLAVTVRRLHDTDKSGWWVLAFLIPLAGFVLWLVFMLANSNPQPNRFGPSPKPGGAMPGYPHPAQGYRPGAATATGYGNPTGYRHDPMPYDSHGGGFDSGGSSD